MYNIDVFDASGETETINIEKEKLEQILSQAGYNMSVKDKIIATEVIANVATVAYSIYVGEDFIGKINEEDVVYLKKIYVNDIDLNYKYIIIDANKVLPYEDGRLDEKRSETIELLQDTPDGELEAQGVQHGFEISEDNGYLCFIDGDDIIAVM